MTQARATATKESTPSPNVRQLAFHWDSHVPHWERAGRSDPTKCFAEMGCTGHVEAGWVTINTTESGAKSTKTTMLTLDKADAERLALWILKTQGWEPANGGIVSPGSIVRPSTLPERSVVVGPR